MLEERTSCFLMKNLNELDMNLLRKYDRDGRQARKLDWRGDATWMLPGTRSECLINLTCSIQYTLSHGKLPRIPHPQKQRGNFLDSIVCTYTLCVMQFIQFSA